jgi:hypothetical protein
MGRVYECPGGLTVAQASSKVDRWCVLGMTHTMTAGFLSKTSRQTWRLLFAGDFFEERSDRKP